MRTNQFNKYPGLKQYRMRFDDAEQMRNFMELYSDMMIPYADSTNDSGITPNRRCQIYWSNNIYNFHKLMFRMYEKDFMKVQESLGLEKVKIRGGQWGYVIPA